MQDRSVIWQPRTVEYMIKRRGKVVYARHRNRVVMRNIDGKTYVTFIADKNVGLRDDTFTRTVRLGVTEQFMTVENKSKWIYLGKVVSIKHISSIQGDISLVSVTVEKKGLFMTAANPE